MKQGAIDPSTKARIDGIQSVIDTYLDCIIETYDNPHPISKLSRDYMRARIRVLHEEKWELVSQI